jgi:flagellin
MAVSAIEGINPNSSRLAWTLSNSILQLERSMLRLATGLRIVSPEDDPGGLAQSIKLDAQVTRIGAVQQNITNASSLTQTQSGLMGGVLTALDRMSVLSVLAQDGTSTASDLEAYQNEFADLQEYITDVTTKQFNGINLFSATDREMLISPEGGTFTLQGIDLAADGAGVGEALKPAVKVDTAADAAAAQTTVQEAIDKLSGLTATVGANLQRLTFSSETLEIQGENLLAASSGIKNVDFASESVRMARLELLVNSANAMLVKSFEHQGTLLRLIDRL